MRFFWPKTIRHRLVLAFAAVLLAALVQGGVGLWSASRLAAATEQTVRQQLPARAALGSLASRAAAYRIGQFQHTLAPETERPGLEAEMARVLTELNADGQRLLELEPDPATRAAFTQFRKAWQAYLEQDRRVRQFMVDGLPLQATELLGGEASMSFDAARDALRNLAEANSARASAFAESASTLRALSQWATALGIAVTLVAAGGLAWPIVRRIARMLEQAQRAAQALAQGKLTLHGDVQGHDELAALMKDLHLMARRWHELVAEVRRGALGVAGASREIAQGSGDLSQRTERQAAYVQEALSLSRALESMATHSAGGVAQADQRSRDSAQHARVSAKMLGELRESILAIHQSARRIADISSLIDGVAHQTNILALNAAVEAARAGEHGRGFAVVASEVRALAHKSAQAALEIKQIAADSIGRSEQGAQLAEQAASGVGELARNSDDAANAVTAIAAAVQTQTGNVGQLNERIALIDGGTQQNSALSEQLAAAATSMDTEAQRLVALMEAFELDADGRQS
ncbi:methyl-accepting chemotaxis protein [Roseateles sp. LYH14W]|uniref:Methyl-accepting chemotaxis protein n=1 Tax=Pelomonas parva TaxID=3299032 RepID=A0ABW7F8N5_9BURK